MLVALNPIVARVAARRWTMPVYRLKDRKAKELGPGVSIKTCWGERMLASVITVEPGASVPLHSHPHEQVGIVLEGGVRMVIGEHAETIGPGDLYVVPPNVPHGGEPLQQRVVILDIFSPVREEYKY
jgi:quercetin dioxygenase-like cupin family protein